MSKFCHLCRSEGAHADNIWAATWSSGRLLTGSLDGTVKLWSMNQDYSECKCQESSKKQTTGVVSLASTSDGSVAIASYQDSVIRLYSTDNLAELSSINCGFLEAWGLSLSPSDDLIASGSQRGMVNVWSMLHGHERVTQLNTHNQFILSPAFNIDSKLASSSIDGYLNIFDVETKQIMHKVEAHSMAARCVVFCPNGKLALTASDDRHVNVYDTVSCSTVFSLSQTAMARSVDISQDQRHIVVGCSDGSVAKWDLGMQKLVAQEESHKSQVWSVCFDKSDPKKSRFASVCDDSLILVSE